MTEGRRTGLQGWPETETPGANESRDRFRRNLARLMADQGITQAALARTMDVSRVAVHAWIWGTCFPETSRLLKLAQALNVQVGTLLESGGMDGEAPTADSANEEALLLDAFRKLPNTARLTLLADAYELSVKASQASRMHAQGMRQGTSKAIDGAD